MHLRLIINRLLQQRDVLKLNNNLYDQNKQHFAFENVAAAIRGLSVLIF